MCSECLAKIVLAGKERKNNHSAKIHKAIEASMSQTQFMSAAHAVIKAAANWSAPFIPPRLNLDGGTEHSLVDPGVEVRQFIQGMMDNFARILWMGCGQLDMQGSVTNQNKEST